MADSVIAAAPVTIEVDVDDMPDRASTLTDTGPRFTMKKSALIEQHVHDWPTVERDIRDATRNGLADVAKAGRREWYEDKALEWARVKGRLQTKTKSVDSIDAAMHRLGRTLPSTKHALGD